MRFEIIHEIPVRISLLLSEEIGDPSSVPDIQGRLRLLPGVAQVRFHRRILRLAVEYDGDPKNRTAVLDALKNLKTEEGADFGRDLPFSSEATLRLRRSIFIFFIGNIMQGLPRLFLVLCGAYPHLRRGAISLLQRKIDTPLLDATAVGAALLLKRHQTAGLISFLLTLGRSIEEFTLQRERVRLSGLLKGEEGPVWIIKKGNEVKISREEMAEGDLAVVRTGAIIPADGQILEGEALVHQSIITGESYPVPRKEGAHVYEGAVVTEGKLVIKVSKVGKETRRAKMVRILQEAEGRKAVFESQAGKLADKTIPYLFSLAGATYLFTSDPLRAASVLMVDYSCALRIALPIFIRTGVLKMAGKGILVKGGKFLETLSRVDTVIFDKTGTLTEGRPRVVEILPLNGYSSDFILRNVACVEEHFPHPISAALVKEADRLGRSHLVETHGEVRYLLSQGILSTVEGKRFIVGNRRTLLEQGVRMEEPPSRIKGWEAAGYSLLFVALEDRLAGIIALDDGVRPEAKEAISLLRRKGIRKIMLLTGDSRARAERVARALGIDEYDGGLFPEEKVKIIQDLKKKGHTVAMVGDGINDSPALAYADVGISLSGGADIALETADVLLLRPRLDLIPEAINASDQILLQVRRGFRWMVGANTTLLGLSLLGELSPSRSAFLHNIATALTSVYALKFGS